MASVRLTVAMRENICRRLLRHRYSARVLDLIERQKVFAADVLADLWTPEERQLLDSLPAGWVPKVTHLGVKLGGQDSSYVSINLDGSYAITSGLSFVRPEGHSYEHQSVRVPYNANNACIRRYDPNHPLAQRYELLSQERSRLSEEIARTKKIVEAQLEEYSTVQSLLKNWPEVEPFLGKYLTPPVRLPALPNQHLNELLDLPVKDLETQQ